MATKGLKIMFLVFFIGIVFTAIYPKVPIIKDSIHAVLDPTAGALLNWNVSLGMLIITAIISIILTLVQKYTTDQESLKQLKQEQKLLQEEMKKFKDHPEKLLELQKKQLEFIPKTMDLTATPLLYTAIPIILFFRWFQEYFFVNQVKIFGFLGWFWAYLIFSIIFSMVWRKLFKLP